MAAQSAVMGEAFGKHYQYGKRKISSMTNEQFNKMDGGDIFGSIVTDYLKIIPQIQKAMTASNEFQSLVIQEIAGIVRSLPSDIVQGFTQGGSTADTATLLDIIKNAALGPVGSDIINQILPSADASPGPATKTGGLVGESLTLEIMKYNYTRAQASVLSRRIENQNISAQEVQSKWGWRLKGEETITKHITKTPNLTKSEELTLKRAIASNDDAIKLLKKKSALLEQQVIAVQRVIEGYSRTLPSARNSANKRQQTHNLNVILAKLNPMRQEIKLLEFTQIRLKNNLRKGTT